MESNKVFFSWLRCFKQFRSKLSKVQVIFVIFVISDLRKKKKRVFSRLKRLLSRVDNQHVRELGGLLGDCSNLLRSESCTDLGNLKNAQMQRFFCEIPSCSSRGLEFFFANNSEKLA